MSRGRAEGRAEGHAEGITEGRAAERVKIQSSNIRQAMSFKFGGVTEEQLQTLLQHCDDDNLLTRILQADSLDGLLLSLKEQS